MSGEFNFWRHVLNLSSASGKKRVYHSLGHIVIMAIGVFFALCIKWLWVGGFQEGNFNLAASIVGIILCAVITVYMFFQGFISQLALIIIAGIGIANPKERGANIIAFLIALITVAGVITACVFLFK